MTTLDFPTQSTRQTVLGGLCWILSIVFFIGQAIAQAAWTGSPAYSIVNDAISDLGITSCGPWPPPGVGSQLAQRLGTSYAYLCSPLHDVMNAAFIVTGALILLGLILTRSAWPRRRLTSWGFAFLALGSVGKIMVGFTPKDVNLIIHALGGLGIACANIGIILLGLAIWRGRRWAAYLSLVSGGVGLIGPTIITLLINHGLGLGERVADYPMIVWMVALGVFFGALQRAE